MAFNANSSTGISSEINVTPLIDVLLVLLIIFMVIVPVMPHGLTTLLPQPPKAQAEEKPEPVLVVQVSSSPSGGAQYALNQQPVEPIALQAELGRILAPRRDKALFVRGSSELTFSEVAKVIGIARDASAEHVGILTPAMEAGR